MPSPFDALRKLMLAINVRANAKALSTDVRRLVAMAVRSKGQLRENIEGMADLMERHSAETSSWVPPEAMADGKGGRFDACDLRHWLALAERAGVPYVPARVVCSLDEEEMGVASGQIQLPDGMRERLAKAVATHLGPLPETEDRAAQPDPESVEEKLQAALDDVPEGWMVRSTRCGPSTLKTLAGVGAAGPLPPEVRFGPDLEVGPGWIRNGNRRRIDASDRRIVEGAAHGPDGPTVFVARPWVPAARFLHGEDPHRHGSQFAGKGIWPMEWRCLVEPDGAGGITIAVASYYGWVGDVSPESARMAIAVRDLCRKVVDEALRQGAVPVYMDLEFLRDNQHVGEFLAERRPPGSFACTMDFIETRGGPLLLEAGPSCLAKLMTSPKDGDFIAGLGGGHPCAYAGVLRPDGVAFRCMSGILIGEPKTWINGKDTEGTILTWAETEALAAEPDPEPCGPSP